MRIKLAILMFLASVGAALALTYAIQVGNYVSIQHGDTPFPENAVFPVPQWAITEQAKYMFVSNGVLYQMDVDQRAVVDAREAQEAADAETAWQTNKPVMLKQVENMYVGFLTNDWTGELRNRGIIASDDVIYVTNTSESANVGYLMTLRAMDTNSLKPTYSFFSNEFSKFKSEIVAYGGIMAKIIFHPEAE